MLDEKFKLAIEHGVIRVMIFGIRCVLILYVAYLLVNSYDHLVKTVQRIVLAVADKRSLLFFGDQTYVLSDVALRLTFEKQLALLTLEKNRVGIAPTLLGQPSKGVARNGFSSDGVLELLLLHSFSIS